jgi:hypothetical protein
MYFKMLRLTSLIFVSLALTVSFTGCDDDSDNGEGPDDGNGNGNQQWEPYKFHPNTTYEYDYTITDNGETTNSGRVQVEIGDPKVTVSWNMDGSIYDTEVNQSDNILENYIQAVASTPLAGVLYQGQWSVIFTNNELETGNSWSYESDEGTMLFEVTGKDSYAGIEGFVLEMFWQDGEEGNVTWESCITPDLPLPLMSYIHDIESDNAFHVELTDYQN